MDVEIENALPQSDFGKALKYAKNLLKYMNTYLTNSCLEIDNNAAEHAVKPFVIIRKNQIFLNISKRARSSEIIYNIVETAKANSLVVERYLTYLFDEISKLEIKDMNILKKFMPCSTELPENLYSIPKK